MDNSWLHVTVCKYIHVKESPTTIFFEISNNVHPMTMIAYKILGPYFLGIRKHLHCGNAKHMPIFRIGANGLIIAGDFRETKE